MIRKLRSGEYRLYSRKINPKTGKRRNLGTFKSRAAAESTSATCSISSGTDVASALVAGRTVAASVLDQQDAADDERNADQS